MWMELRAYKVGDREVVEMKGDTEEFAALAIDLVEHQNSEPYTTGAERASERIRWMLQKYFNPSSTFRG